jgi:hypothetical protein
VPFANFIGLLFRSHFREGHFSRLSKQRLKSIAPYQQKVREPDRGALVRPPDERLAT